MRSLLRWLLRILYRFRAYNVAVARHARPGPAAAEPRFVVGLAAHRRLPRGGLALRHLQHHGARSSWFHKRIMVNRRTFPVDMNSPFAVKHMAEYLQKGGRLVLFPEGRLSCTGSLMKLFDGTGFLIFKTRAKVITAYIRGAERLPFSRSPGRKQWFPRLSVHFSDVLAHARLGARQRHRGARAAHRLAARPDGPATVRDRDGVRPGHPAGGHPAKPRGNGPGKSSCRTLRLQKLTYRRLLVGRGLAGGQWRELLSDAEQRVGVLLPNVNAMPVVTLSLWAAGKVPAILNYSTGRRHPAGLRAARRAEAHHHLAERSSSAPNSTWGRCTEAGIELLFLEDVRARITAPQRMLALLRQSLEAPSLNSQLSTLN